MKRWERVVLGLMFSLSLLMLAVSMIVGSTFFGGIIPVSLLVILVFASYPVFTGGGECPRCDSSDVFEIYPMPFLRQCRDCLNIFIKE